MKKSILITGGARSGKSELAERLVGSLGDSLVYIATAEAHDDAEMATRIAHHQARRGPQWRTIAEPLDVAGALDSSDGEPRLVDCLTLWVSNLMHAGRDIEAAAATLCETLSRQSAPVVLVTNEVGSGIVPENALARRFRDEAGRMNQRIAAACDEVYLAVCGQALKVKPNDANF